MDKEIIKDLRYEELDENNLHLYEEFLSEVAFDPDDKDILLFGVEYKGKAAGVVVLHKDSEKELSIRSLQLIDGENTPDIVAVILKGFEAYAIKEGYEKIICRYTDDDGRITKDILKKAGFDEFYGEADVYRIDAYTLGSLLRDGPVAQLFKDGCMKLMKSGHVFDLGQLSPKETEPLLSLYPMPDLSTVTVDDEGYIRSYVIVSKLPDGSIYLSDILNQEEDRESFAGLIYMGLGKIFMRIHPDGDFYIAAINESYRRLMEVYLSPVIKTIGRQHVLSAGRRLKKI